MTTSYKLVVVHAIGDYRRGDVIENEEFVKQILDPEHENHGLIHHVVKVAKNPAYDLKLSSVAE